MSTRAAPWLRPPRSRLYSRGRPLMNQAAGFTLLEMTIALLLLALMSAVLFGSLRLAARSWDGGEAKAAQASDIRQTELFLREHLASQYPQRMRKVIELPLIFSGDRDEVRYAAAMPARIDDGGIYYFRLAVAKDGDKSRLVLDRVVPDLDGTTDISFTDAERSVLADDIGEIRIEYYGRDKGSVDAVEPTWRDRWDDKQKLPLAMRIEIRPVKGAPWPLILVEPRRAPEAGCRNWEPVQQRCVGQA